MKSHYTNFEIRIKNSDILVEVKNEVRLQVESILRHREDRVNEMNKSLIQLQKETASLKVKCNRLESQLK